MSLVATPPRTSPPGRSAPRPCRLLRGLPMGDEVLEDLDEVGTVQGHLDRSTRRACGGGGADDVRDHLGQVASPPGWRWSGAGETQAAQDGLLRPPLRGGVDQGLMLEELLGGERVEAGAARRRIRREPAVARARKPRVTSTRSGGSKRPASRARSRAAASASGASGAGPGSTPSVSAMNCWAVSRAWNARHHRLQGVAKEGHRGVPEGRRPRRGQQLRGPQVGAGGATREGLQRVGRIQSRSAPPGRLDGRRVEGARVHPGSAARPAATAGGRRKRPSRATRGSEDADLPRRAGHAPVEARTRFRRAVEAPRGATARGHPRPTCSLR